MSLKKILAIFIIFNFLLLSWLIFAAHYTNIITNEDLNTRNCKNLRNLILYGSIVDICLHIYQFFSLIQLSFIDLEIYFIQFVFMFVLSIILEFILVVIGIVYYIEICTNSILQNFTFLYLYITTASAFFQAGFAFYVKKVYCENVSN